MKSKNLVKNLSVATALAIGVTALTPTASHVYAAENNENTSVSNTNAFNQAEIEKRADYMPSVHEMSQQERELFDRVVQEEAELNGGDNKELYKQVITDFYDETSGHAYDLDYAQAVVQENTPAPSIPEGAYASLKLGIGTKIAGSVLNVAIGVAVGGGVGAIQAFIISKGKKEAQKIFTRTVVSRLNAWGASKLAWTVGFAVAVAMDYANIGYQIAVQIDKRDKRPNNGYIDFV